VILHSIHRPWAFKPDNNSWWKQFKAMCKETCLDISTKESRIGPSKPAKKVNALTFIREEPTRISVQTPDILTEVLVIFLSLQINVGTVVLLG